MPDEFLIAEEAKPEAETEEPETVASEARLEAARGRLKLEPGHERGIGSRHHNLHPAHKAHLAAIEHLGGRGVIITAAGDRTGVDCVSRFFAPSVGIPEDPATGSAHCALASYWGARLGREVLVGEQASKRGGVIHMGLAGDRIVLGGRAVTVSKVSLLV